MKKFKGIKTTLLGAALVSLLTGCGNEEASTEKKANSTSSKIETVSANSSELALPMKSGDFQVTTTFGEQPDPLSEGGTRNHTGYDLKAEEGTEYYAIAKSEVVKSNASKTAGWIINTEILEGPLKGFSVDYLHSFENDIVVKLGDVLEEGDLIAKVGKNGNALDFHLHITLRDVDGNPVDLADYCQELKTLVENTTL